MQVVLFNVKTQQSYPCEINNDIGTNFEDIRLLCDGNVYRLINTIPDEVKTLNALREAFETAEFDRLIKTKFNYKTKEEIPVDFEAQFVAELDTEEVQNKYPDFFKSIKDNKQQVFHTLCTHYLTFMFMARRFNDILESNKQNMLDKSYAKDFAMRFKRLFAMSTWYNNQSLVNMYEQLEELRRFMDIDDRRHAGYDKLMGGIAQVSAAVGKLLVGGASDSVKNSKITEDDKENSKLFKSISKAFTDVHKYYEDFIKDIDNTVAKVTELDKDKHIAYLKVLRPVITQFMKDTDLYMKEASKVEDGDKARLELVKNAYITALKSYFDNINNVFISYDSDTREVDKEVEKQFIAVWESSNYFKNNSGAGDWFIQLARLMYKSYNDLFAEILTDDEKIVPGEEPKETDDKK